MGFASMPTLLLAAVLASPALWSAFVTHEMDYAAGLTRYLIAVGVAALMLSMLRGLANGYRRSAAAAEPAAADQEPGEGQPSRRRSDSDAPDAIPT